ncbi:MAG: hypothetical protein OEZ39_18105 [Gammaproteobacteria bacterium]|nr:hypothetical protein [Gammaproteobacteria bacterium]MDH5653780.1 hypothetical protein [Gammaproteobacteria bacterium]
MRPGRQLFAAVFTLLLVACGGGDDPPPNPPAPPGPYSYWNETAVRKVLHTFAYGGHASDNQIRIWARMHPRDAIQQILTFDRTNPWLSPPEDTVGTVNGSLRAMQELWGDNTNPDNLHRDDVKQYYAFLALNPTTSMTYVEAGRLQNTWTGSINKHGVNPFRQKIGLFLTNYHMAVSFHKVRPQLIRSMYDKILDALEAGEPFENVLAIGATSPAVAMQYGHMYNSYNNTALRFYGNDDFAREFHQLFFRILGADFSQDYHENTTIEHTAWALTGMRIDRDPAYWGSDNTNDYWTDMIVYTDHRDAENTLLNNYTNHHWNNLEILGTTISGNTAQEKIQALAQIAVNQRESLDEMPIFIINFLADDNLTAEKIAEIRALWRSIQPKNLLTFLQEYAISGTFHRSDTWKYKTAFARNLAIYNLNTVNNEDAYARTYFPTGVMTRQGASVFAPAHDVFGGQTSINAANNPDIFKDAYNLAVDASWAIYLHTATFQRHGSTVVWNKDWALVIPRNADGIFTVDEVGEWLWQRFVADGLKNYGPLERAYVNAFLATGIDLGMLFDATNPDAPISTAMLNSEPYKTYLKAYAETVLTLDSSYQPHRLNANLNVGLAVNFISATPFVFAMEGR